MAYCTAHYGLIDLARLEKGKSVLIHGATSASGQAAICLAQMLGAEIFATVDSAESKELLKKVYDMSDDHIFSTQTIFSGLSIGQKTSRGLFDVVLNCVPTDADTLRDMGSRLCNFGLFIEAAIQETNAKLDAPRFEGNKSYMCFDLTFIAVERPILLTRLLSNVCQLLEHRKIRSVASIQIFSISQIETAFKLLQSGNREGKLVIVPHPGDMVKVMPMLKHSIV